MDAAKKKKLEEKGWTVGDTSDFLGLTTEETIYTDLKVTLGTVLKQVRERNKATQKDAAALSKTSQSRIANLEAGDPSVTIDRQIKALLSIGGTKADLSQAINQLTKI